MMPRHSRSWPIAHHFGRARECDGNCIDASAAAQLGFVRDAPVIATNESSSMSLSWWEILLCIHHYAHAVYLRCVCCAHARMWRKWEIGSSIILLRIRGRIEVPGAIYGAILFGGLFAQLLKWSVWIEGSVRVTKWSCPLEIWRFLQTKWPGLKTAIKTQIILGKSHPINLYHLTDYMRVLCQSKQQQLRLCYRSECVLLALVQQSELFE